MASGTKTFRGTTLITPYGVTRRTSNKVPTRNGGNRAPLLTVRNGFTEPTREADRSVLCTGSQQPPAL
jgi:hypothetical protein